MDYRAQAQITLLVLNTIISLCGIADNSSVDESEFNGIFFSMCVNPVYQEYLGRTFSALKSVLRSQYATVLELHLLLGFQISEVWEISLFCGRVPETPEVQALVNDITLTMDNSHSLANHTFRICLKVDNKHRIPTQCILFNNSKSLRSSQETRTTTFRNLGFMMVRKYVRRENS